MEQCTCMHVRIPTCMCMFVHNFLGRLYSVFRNRFLYGFMFVYRVLVYPAELNFRVFIFANGALTINIVYITNDLY